MQAATKQHLEDMVAKFGADVMSKKLIIEVATSFTGPDELAKNNYAVHTYNRGFIMRPKLIDGLFFGVLRVERPKDVQGDVTYKMIRHLVAKKATIKIIHEPASLGIPETERINFFATNTETLEFPTTETQSKKQK